MASSNCPSAVAIGIPVGTNTRSRIPVRTKKRRPCCSSSFDPVLCVILTIFSILILASIAFLIAMAVVPSPSQPEISVVSASASSFNLTSFPTQLSGDFDFTLSVINPNKHYELHYDNVEVALAYGANRTTIVEGSLTSFGHGRRNPTTVMGRLIAFEEHLLPDVGSRMADYLAARKAVIFSLKLTARVSFHPAWMTDDKAIELHCEDITIRFAKPDAGTTVETPKMCDMVTVWDV